MTDHLGGASIAGVQMKTDYGWSQGSNGTNSSFSGLPGGIRSTDGYFVDAGYSGNWWGSTPLGSLTWFCQIQSPYESADLFIWPRKTGLSVRCIKDTE